MKNKLPPNQRLVIAPVIWNRYWLRAAVCNANRQWVEEKRLGPTIEDWKEISGDNQ